MRNLVMNNYGHLFKWLYLVSIVMLRGEVMFGLEGMAFHVSNVKIFNLEKKVVTPALHTSDQTLIKMWSVVFIEKACPKWNTT